MTTLRYLAIIALIAVGATTAQDLNEKNLTKSRIDSYTIVRSDSLFYTTTPSLSVSHINAAASMTSFSIIMNNDTSLIIIAETPIEMMPFDDVELDSQLIMIRDSNLELVVGVYPTYYNRSLMRSAKKFVHSITARLNEAAFELLTTNPTPSITVSISKKDHIAYTDVSVPAWTEMKRLMNVKPQIE